VFTVEKSKAGLKAELERVLRQSILQATFDKLDGFGGAIEQYYEGLLEEGGEKENFKALKGIFAQELEYLKNCEREKAQSTKPPSDEEEYGPVIEPGPPPSDYVTARASAISEFLAMLADARPDVAEFRRRVLGGRLLSPEEAAAMVDALGSVEEGLHELGSRLANDYLGWDEEGAIWYILTGEAPRLRAIKIRGRGKFPGAFRPFQQSLTLTVLPWVPAKEVQRVYRNIQQQTLEKTSRETGTRILEVARFYWEQLRLNGSLPDWPTWAVRWNETHSDKKFPTWRHFREYLTRGVKAALPHYKFSEPKPSPEVRAARDALMERLEQSFSRAEARLIEGVPPYHDDE
jgi:hypothetical protein